MSAGPRFVLHQLNVAAAPTHDLGHQDVGSGAADTSVITSQTLTNLHTHKIYTHKVIHARTLTQSEAAFRCPPPKPRLDTAGSDKQTLT